jgi:soluble lytic murein transglycosylase-like protein
MGTQYLKTLYQLFQGNWELAVAAYNSGMGRVWGTDTTWYEKYPGGGTEAQRRDDPGTFTVPAPSAGYVDEVFERSPQLTALLPPRKLAN